jgi:hypothetical protein
MCRAGLPQPTRIDLGFRRQPNFVFVFAYGYSFHELLGGSIIG